MHIYYRESLDAFNFTPQKIKKYRENLQNNKIIWKKYHINTKYYKNKLNFNYSDSDNKKKIYDIPIFHIKSEIDERLISWILSFELNDLIRIMIENDLLFSSNGSIIVKK